MTRRDDSEIRQEKVRLSTANTLRYLSSLYEGDPFEAVAQLVENAIDATTIMRDEYTPSGEYQPRIWISLTGDPRAIEVIDNGHGMVRDLRPEDQIIVDQNPTGDIRSRISATSRRSIRWMMRNIALSSKMPGQNPSVKGMRGVGFLAYLELSQVCEVYTRPAPALIHIHSGKPQSAPVYVLYPPSYDDLETHTEDVPFSHEESRDTNLLSDPWGKPIGHGTRVVLRHVSEEILGPHFPVQLQAYLTARFGHDIKARGIQLRIVDRVSPRGRKTQGGLLLDVKPTERMGALIFYRQVEVELDVDGKRVTAPMEIRLTYRQNESKPEIVVLRKGGATLSKLTDYDEFKTQPWTLLSGEAGFPNVPDDARLWDASKHHLKPSKARTRWIQVVKGWEREIATALEEYQAKLKEQETSAVAEDIAQAARQAMQEIPYFSGETFTEIREERGVSQRERHPRQTTPISAVTNVLVLNEHNQPVHFVTVELWQGRTFIDSKQTELSGKKSFGKLSRGTYTFKVIPRDNMVPQKGKAEITFTLSDEEPGKTVIFHLITGAPKPEKRQLAKDFKPYFHPFDDSDQPYRNRLDIGVIEYNTAARPLADATAKNDSEARTTLLASYTAAAIAEHYVKGDPTFVLLQRELLFERIWQHMRTRDTVRKQKRARRKRHTKS